MDPATERRPAASTLGAWGSPMPVVIGTMVIAAILLMAPMLPMRRSTQRSCVGVRLVDSLGSRSATTSDRRLTGGGGGEEVKMLAWATLALTKALYIFTRYGRSP